ncbi:MAG TPA: hypothetical protein VKV17_06855 [Bryobacteraceae bacterium]|jgi:hypothetical protein|nr:hypothetical protein [Bryobacteraceae bacterium]
MPFTQADLDALDAARKQGARRIRFQDRDFEFDTVDDYIKLRNLILNDIAQQNGPQQIRQVRVYTNSGWGK